MSDEESKPPSEKPTSEEAVPFDWITPEEGVCEVYSNYLHLNWTLFDVRIRFGQVVADPRRPPHLASWVIDEGAAITMPWAHAKFLRDTLNTAIQRYENLNGEITLPKMPI